jgi:hypothetical protein
MEKFLVRSLEKTITGPFTKKELIQKKPFQPRDEICASEGYWIPCQDIKAITDLLAVSLIDPMPEEIDSTRPIFLPQKKQKPTYPLWMILLFFIAFSTAVFLKLGFGVR